MTLVYLDTETTGLEPYVHHVWEAAYAADSGPIVTTKLVHTTFSADPRALELNGYAERGAISTHAAHKAALVGETALRLALTGATIVGANPAFDTSFLRARWGSAPWHYRLLDIEAYAAGVFGWDRPKGLAAIAEALGRRGFDTPDPDHTAAGDVATLRSSFSALRLLRAGGTPL